jgi:hypothetical protein
VALVEQDAVAEEGEVHAAVRLTLDHLVFMWNLICQASGPDQSGWPGTYVREPTGSASGLCRQLTTRAVVYEQPSSTQESSAW